jgi:lysine 2,3-aminomutase
MVKGVEDLRTPLKEIIKLDKQIRGTLSGFMMPSFVIDLPGGGGKRLVSTHESYSETTGIAIYRAPGLDGEKGHMEFTYNDPKAVAFEDLVRLRQQKAQALETGQTLEELTRKRHFMPSPSAWDVPIPAINRQHASQLALLYNEPAMPLHVGAEISHNFSDVHYAATG